MLAGIGEQNLKRAKDSSEHEPKEPDDQEQRAIPPENSVQVIVEAA
jgi:hypothetical protein